MTGHPSVTSHFFTVVGRKSQLVRRDRCGSRTQSPAAALHRETRFRSGTHGRKASTQASWLCSRPDIAEDMADLRPSHAHDNDASSSCVGDAPGERNGGSHSQGGPRGRRHQQRVTRDDMAWGDRHGVRWVDRDRLNRWAHEGKALHELLGLPARRARLPWRRAA